MGKILTMKDSISVGKHKKKPISEIVNIKGEIFKYIKEGYQFDDEVLEMAHINKTKRDEKVMIEFVNHKKKKEKEYPKETESVKSILKTINTIDSQNISEKSFYTQNEDDVEINLNEEE